MERVGVTIIVSLREMIIENVRFTWLRQFNDFNVGIISFVNSVDDSESYIN